VLIYPEVGMNPMAIKLAGLRLAPVQCMAGGHPITSGLPTMDYFLSSDVAEPPDGAAHYTEKLVRLPNMSTSYRMPTSSASNRTRADFGLRHGAVFYLCIQTLFPYLPQYDDLYPRIARQVPNCQFVFIKHWASEPISRILVKCLGRAFSHFGLNWEDYVVFLPRLRFNEYHGLQDMADIYLDSVGWNGDTTTINAIAHDLPIVTLPGRFFRGRRGMGMLSMLGVNDTIAADCNHYVEIAVCLGQGAAWRQDVREKMARNKHKVFNDRKCIEGLEDFLVQGAHGSVTLCNQFL
jgi:protein O-GlcNAc transferase